MCDHCIKASQGLKEAILAEFDLKMTNPTIAFLAIQLVYVQMLVENVNEEEFEEIAKIVKKEFLRNKSHQLNE